MSVDFGLQTLHIEPNETPKELAPMKSVLTGSKFDFIATHYCSPSIYRVSHHQQAALEKHIPDNLFEMTREELAPVVKSLMEAMDILWSSSGGIPSFPEKFGEHTRLSVHHDRIYMSGRGWSVEIYNGRYADIQPALSNRISSIISDKKMTEEEKVAAISAISGPMATPIG